ncbi:unnamed protein product [Adineta steineri]|uniref:RNA-dependent RNA polymerase n=1 Tax=Adineta steineri TaxID=433720 RepID=A0A814ML73_9BILA|nr:unnamed protein product [Adineta steineri]
MDILSSVAWVKRGAAKATPIKFMPDEEELNNGSDHDDDDDEQKTKDVEMDVEKDDENADDEDNVIIPGVGPIGMYASNRDDPLLEIKDDGEDSDAEDFLIRPDDNLIVAAHIEDDTSSLEVYVYNDKEGYLYVHHDILMLNMPLCLTWFDYDINDGNTEKSCSWHFGLTSIHLHFIEPQFINIQWLCSPISIPFWITFNKEKKQYINKNCTTKQPIRHKFTKDFITSLRYGALTDITKFHYSPKHSWTNQQDLRNNEDRLWFLSLDDQRNGGGYIEWIIENSEKKEKKQLLVTNINHSIIIDSDENGFDIYIFQHCNMNEFGISTNHKSYQNGSSRPRSSSRQSGRQSSSHRSNSRPRAPPPLQQTTSEPRQSRRKPYDKYRRIGFRSGCYFSTIQFSLRINRSRLTQSSARSIEVTIKQTLSLLIEFFIAHNLTVCFGKIDSIEGPNPYLFFKPNIPNFPSHIMKYSWQILSTVGYRLQLQIDEEFLQKLFQLSRTEENPDELFYRVCVYLSRIFSLKPFVNIINELEHAVDQSKRKRDASAYGLIRKIDVNDENEAYIPSVTLTPTTIRIKPLKLCRTNRVLRANIEFGEPLYHFILVDIRDENGRNLQSFHFGDLREFLLKYLVEGFIIMDDHRQYQYLHHSQSQLRQRQFWFYHHNIDGINLSFPDAYRWMGNFDDEKNPAKYAARMALCFSTTKATVDVPRQFWFYHHNIDGINLSFDDAYRWMGNFDDEKNPAKYAARMALCFSTTKATVDVPAENVILGAEDIEVNNNDKVLSFTDGCGKMSKKLRNQIKDALGMRNDFSAVQFRYAGTKGVVSLDTTLPENIDLYIRKSMTKFQSDHQCFEVCKLSAPRPLYLNRQAILLLSYRQIPDTIFLILQQQNHLDLIRALLRNSDAEKLILEKIPSWFLPRDIHIANIDFVREPFFRQLLINGINLSFPDAYRWMGNFDDEKNPAKYAARMALCFSTTKATVDVPAENVILGAEDIEVNKNDKVLSFTDGCGKMSKKLRNQIKDALGMRNDFSAVQFRYAGTKGVVSLDTSLPDNIDLYIRKSMTKFQSDHQCFEVCKLSAPRPLYLNRQAILLLSYRQVPDTTFLILQQQNHLDLIRALLRNSDAEKLILEKIPSWFLPRDIHIANIDFVREPFFRQLLITAFTGTVDFSTTILLLVAICAICRAASST